MGRPGDGKAVVARKGFAPHRSVNIVKSYLGVPGTGKSTLAMSDMVKDQRALGGAYMIVHDIGDRLPEAWPDAWGGKPTGIIRHATVGEARAALAAKPDGIHALSTSDGGAVMELAVQAGASSKAAGAAEGASPPVLLMLDEAVGTAAASPYRMGDDMREFIAGRRHMHVGLYWTCQSPAMAHYGLLALSTEIVVGRIVDERALARFEQLGFTPGEIDRIRTMPNHSFIRHKM